jgi:GMP synthase-like glutamine amidotransferase
MHILCLQHVPFETPSTIADWAIARRHALRIELMGEAVRLPRLADVDMLVLMGGPMSVHDTATLPWLEDEKQYLRRALALGKRVLGVCLGAQLIADALGAPVTRNRYREIGWFPLQRSEGLPDHLAALLPRSMNAFHWHGETFALPPGAVRLASSAACANQLFVIGDTVLGMQCHLEVTPEDAGELADACADELIDAPYVQDMKTITGQPQRFASANVALVKMLDGFFPG